MKLKKVITIALATILMTPAIANAQSIFPESYTVEARQAKRNAITQEELRRQKEELEKEIQAEKSERRDKWINQLESTKGLYIFKIDNKEYTQKVGTQVITREMELAPFIHHDKTYLPVRYVAEALGLLVEFDNDTREVILYSGFKDIEITINIDTGETLKNGARVEIEEPMIIEDRTVLPIGDISLVLELTKGVLEDGIAQQVEWDNTERAVYVVNI